MSIPTLSDCHTHSTCSPDGESTPREQLARAVELNLYAWTLTDHCEAQAWEEDYRARSENARAAMAELAALAPAGLHFYRGIELGQATQNPEAARLVWEHPDYDFVIGSIHNLRKKEDFYYMKYEPEKMADVHELLTKYWAEELEMIALGYFDSLGHLTYPLRYMETALGHPVDLTPHREAIDAIFKALIRTDKALEVNTSGLRQGLGKTFPDLPLVKRYRELGGRLVTLGSDAHRTADLASGIPEGMAMLREAGFTEYHVYQKHTPAALPLAE